MINGLSRYVRPVTEKDRKTQPFYSYSKLDGFKKCPYQFNIKYNLGRYTSDTSLALEQGSLCHYVLEQKGRYLKSGQPVDYMALLKILHEGVHPDENDTKTKENLSGIEEQKARYFEDWYTGDNASGMDYEQKMEVFKRVLYSEMENTEWKPIEFEHPFEFVYKDRIILYGFIDRIDRNEKWLRTIDYKTSKKSYPSSDVATSLQFGVYAQAIINEYGVVPKESIYRFILIDEEQKALTKGWERRLVSALDKILDSIDECTETGIWTPKPTPLCYWCNYCRQNVNAKDWKNECDYYSLWTPTQKTFNVNKPFDPDNNTNKNEDKRILIF